MVSCVPRLGWFSDCLDTVMSLKRFTTDYTGWTCRRVSTSSYLSLRTDASMVLRRHTSPVCAFRWLSFLADLTFARLLPVSFLFLPAEPGRLDRGLLQFLVQLPGTIYRLNLPIRRVSIAFMFLGNDLKLIFFFVWRTDIDPFCFWCVILFVRLFWHCRLVLWEIFLFREHVK